MFDEENRHPTGQRFLRASLGSSNHVISIEDSTNNLNLPETWCEAKHFLDPLLDLLVTVRHSVITWT